jgi:serine/threonine-protein kinase
VPPRYELLEELGKGGMGEVYRGRDRLLGREVALKRIRRGLAGPDELLRFRREAQAVARLRHRHIVALYDLGEHDGEPYLVMALVGGGTLAGRLGDFADPRAAAALVEKVARAVQAAHEAGVVHRDLKPSNILLDEAGEPHVSDFGLAKFLDPDGGEEATHTGQVIGTPAYMAPEQAAGHGNRATAASDVWALGVILFELLTRQKPFPGAGAELARRIQQEEARRPRTLRPELDRALENVVLKCLEREPARRHPSAAALADELGRWLRGEAVRTGPPPWPARLGRRLRRYAVPGALLVLLALAAGAGLFYRHVTDPDRRLWAIEDRLARGETVVYPDGETPWFRAPLHPVTLLDPAAGGGALSFQSFDPCLMELLPAGPPAGFRLHAKVRHEESATGGQVGLYFGRSAHATAHGEVHCFCAFTYSDLENLAEDPVRHERSSWAVLTVEGVARSPAFSPGAMPTGPRAYFPPAWLLPERRKPWRDLGLEVTPEQITAFWEGERTGTVPRTQLQEFFNRVNGPYDRQRYAPELHPEFGPRGGLGLFVRQGWASFRDISVEPLGVSAPAVSSHKESP